MKLLQLCLATFLLSAGRWEAAAFQAPERPALPNFDRREAAVGSARGSGTQQEAAAALRAQLPGVRVDFDPVTGAPAMVSGVDGLLTGAGGQGKTVSAAARAAFAPEDANGAAKAFLSEHRALFGYGPEALDGAKVRREFVSAHNGLHTVVWEQQVDGIPVFEAVLIAHTTRAGELVNLSSRFVAQPGQAADRGLSNRAAVEAAPPLSAAEAVARAAGNVGEAADSSLVSAGDQPVLGAERAQKLSAPFLLGPAEAKLTWLPMDSDTLRLCWEVILTSRARGEMFRVLVDAQTGEVPVRHCLTDYLSDATYNVFTSDSPSPFSPGWPTPLTGQPSLVSRTLVTWSALDTNASPAGWINDGGNETLGNNVDAHTDRNNDNVPDLPRPQGSPSRVFNFTLDLSTQDPTNYSQAAVVQLFYLCNWMHDQLYQLGFTEAAGNFQSNNFGRGGLGNDALQADAQDGGGYNNANMSTPPDGSAPRMQMYLFSGPNPRRDGDFDAEVVLHEYTHGLSNRRVGGGVGISALQSGGMGEGWSDFYAATLLSEAGDDVNGCYASGAYVSYLLSAGFTQNYYFGIRRYPYSTDLSKNPLTFKDIDPSQASAHTGIPRSPVIGTTANEVHNMGEVWCVTLWEVRANLISKLGYSVGNRLTLQLITDAMNLSPANPNFLQARNAILQADMVDDAATNRAVLWAAFAKRGMGASATSPASSTTSGLVEAYDIPDDLTVSPTAGLAGSGAVGGPFTPACQNYVLGNSGSSNLSWYALSSQPWVSLSPTSGSLAPGATGTVSVCFGSAANTFTAGTYTASVMFSNALSGMCSLRPVSLAVSPPRALFFGLDTDPGWSRQGEWAFGHPAGLGSGYPDPANGATGSNVFGINLNGNYSTTIGGPYYLTAGPFDFSAYSGMRLQFQRWLNSDYPPYVYETVEVSSNGSTWSAIWTNTSSVTIADNAWTKLSYDISAVADRRSTVYVRWGHRIGSSGAIALSGWNIDDVEFLGTPLTSLALSLPATATEGDGVVTGTVTTSLAPANDVTVALASSDPTEVLVPASVTIAAGQSNATFNITIVDDGVLDGPQTATISATAPAFAPGFGAITVLDNEKATLGVTAPAAAIEGAAPVQCSVELSGTPSADIQVALTSSDTTALQVPPWVTLSAGQTSAVFFATIVDDTRINGDHTATITAHVSGWTDGQGTLLIHDNESTNLTVVLPPSAREGDGTVANGGSVRLAGTLPSSLTVTLACDNTTELTVPASVTIPAGQTSAAFDLTVGHDPAVTGTAMAGVSASAAGFGSGGRTMLIYDKERPFAPANPAPADLASNVIQTTTLAWVSGVAPGETLTNEVYFGTAPVPGPAQLLGSTTGTNWTLPTLAPLTTYYWQVAAHNAGTTVGPVWCFTTRGVDHFDWAAVSSPQYVGQGFPVLVTAKDALNNTVSNFSGTVGLAVPGSLALTPTNSGTFVNGAWQGNLTVLEPHTNVVLKATDADSHTGSSNPFDVLLKDDLSLAVVDAPRPVSVGANLAYTLTVANTGPSAATGVMLTNLLPANATFVSAVSSQGVCSQADGVVTCALGSLNGGANATVTILVQPTLASISLTNIAWVSRAEADSYPANNTATNITPVTLPAISIADAACLEGNVGLTSLVFQVTLAAPSAQTITVNYATAANSATAGSDFLSTNGVLSFPPGVTNQTAAVLVVGDVVVEPNETFFVSLSNPVNGLLGRSQATGTIVNDDGLPGQVDHFAWNTVASPQYVGVPFPVTVSALDLANNPAASFNGQVSFSASAAGPLITNFILGNYSAPYSGSGTYTMGFSFTPNTNLTVTHVRSFSGTKVSIWTDTGTLLATQPVSGTSGLWTETPLTTPLVLNAGTTYRVGFYTGGSSYYYTYAYTNAFPYGALNQVWFLDVCNG